MLIVCCRPVVDEQDLVTFGQAGALRGRILGHGPYEVVAQLGTRRRDFQTTHIVLKSFAQSVF